MIFCVCLFRNTTKNLCSVNIGRQGPSTFLMVTSWSIVIAQQKATGFAYLVKACGNKACVHFNSDEKGDLLIV